MDQSSSGVAKSVDDLVTSRSVEGHDFPDVEMLIAKMASASKRIFSNQYFRRKNRAACSKKYDRSLGGRRIASSNWRL